jgi:hypothetical protein
MSITYYLTLLPPMKCKKQIHNEIRHVRDAATGEEEKKQLQWTRIALLREIKDDLW